MPSTTSPTGGMAPGRAFSLLSPLSRLIVLVAIALCFMACICILPVTSNWLQRPNEVLILPTYEPTFHIPRSQSEVVAGTCLNCYCAQIRNTSLSEFAVRAWVLPANSEKLVNYGAAR